MAVTKFKYSGASKTFVVPAGVTSIFVELWGGASGPSWWPGAAAQRNAKVSGTLAVTPGQQLTIQVAGDGGAAAHNSSSMATLAASKGGYPNGGATSGIKGINTGAPGYCCTGAGGGGATTLQAGGAVIAGAGGQGGHGGSFGGGTNPFAPGLGATTTASGGSADTTGTNGGAAAVSTTATGSSNSSGIGGTQTIPGAAGVGNAGGGTPAVDGSGYAWLVEAGNPASTYIGGKGGGFTTYANAGYRSQMGGGGGGGGAGVLGTNHGYGGGGGASVTSGNFGRQRGAAGGAGASYVAGLTATASVPTGRMSTTIDSYWPSSGGFARLTYNLPPTQPTVTTPVPASGNIDLTAPFTVTWTATDPDPDDTIVASYMQWRTSSSGAWTNIQLTSDGSTSYVFPANYWSAQAATPVEYQIQTVDNHGASSPWSSSAIFDPQNPPAAPTISSPAANAVIAAATVDLSWTAASQTKYQVQVLEEDDVTVDYDSGAQTGTNAVATLPLVNNGVYVRLQVRVIKSTTADVWSAWAEVRVQVQYNPPNTPTFSMNPDSSDMSVDFVINNTSTGQAVAYNDLYMIDPDGTTRRVATMLGVGTAVLYTYQTPGVGSRFYFVAVGTNGATKQSVTSVALALPLNGVWLLDPTDPVASVMSIVFNDHGADETYAVEAVANHYMGRPLPVVDFGEAVDQSLTINLYEAAENAGAMLKLRALLKRQVTLLYRDRKGRRLYGYFSEHPLSDVRVGYDSQLVFTVSDYNEVV